MVFCIGVDMAGLIRKLWVLGVLVWASVDSFDLPVVLLLLFARFPLTQVSYQIVWGGGVWNVV